MSQAKQIDFLLSGYQHPTTDEPLSGGKVITYLDGTSTLSALWTDKDKGGVATNPIILDSSGKAKVYGDNIYKFEIYDSSDNLIETLTGLEYKSAQEVTKTYDTFNDLETATNINVGDLVETSGYYSADGSGGASYIIVPLGTGTIINGYFDLSGASLQAKLVKPDYVTPYIFGAYGDGTNATITTAALNNAYNYCKSFSKWQRIPFHLPAGKFLFESGLTWDGSVNVVGESSEKTILLKNGNFVGITINGDQCQIGGFQLYSPTGAILAGDTSDGIYIEVGHLTRLFDIHVEFQGGNGITVKAFTSAEASKILTRFNGKTGIDINSTGGIYNTNASVWGQVDSLGNADHGVHIQNGDNDYSVYQLLTCQQNGKHGLFLEGIGNKINFYGESNDQDGGGAGAGTYRDFYASAQSIRNSVTILSATSNAAKANFGTNNVILDIGTTCNLSIVQVAREKKSDNTAGDTLTIAAGNAGSGATPQVGGDLYLYGGDADGIGDIRGGNATLRAGEGVGTGGPGSVYIQSSITKGGTYFGGGVNPGYFTTAERDAALIAGTLGYGSIINNSTTGKLQRYNSTAWVDLD